MDQPGFLAETDWLRRELCIRLASSTREALSLPFGMPDHAGLRDVIGLHAETLVYLDRLPQPALPSIVPGASSFFPKAREDSGEAFLHTIEHTLDKHAGVIAAMVKGMYSAASDLGHVYQVVQPQIDGFLERFFLTHIGLRFRLSHHARLRRAVPEPGFVGALELSCQPAEVARLAAKDSRAACVGQLGQAPAIVVREAVVEGGGTPTTCTHWPSALRYVLREVFKNACRAVVERHSDGFDDELPPVYCTIHSGPRGVTLCISDQGGGIPETELENVGKFMYTTYGSYGDLAASGQHGGTPLAGYGVGLALSRLFLRYLGSDLSIESRPGFGTEVCLHLCDVRECFEHLSQTSPWAQP